ncbi:MAG TPA: hypothetical protein VLN08_00335 [Vicinamibacterales bacterium]|nr:hypothetical protein [Vicinamibacterales bacterium]
MKNGILIAGVVVMTAAALACGEQAATPAAPSAVASDTAAAAADGSTLKATAPAPQQPANASTVDSLTPNLVIANATLKHLGDVSMVGTLQYRFVVETAGGAPVISALTGAGAALTGSRVAANALQAETSYRWRARAEREGAFGPWSNYWTFSTPKPAPAPAPAPKGGGAWPTTTNGLVDFVASNYPQYLKATSSLHDREVNMAYLRDRMIEAGICGGFDLAWNLKRGVGPRSTDALLWRDGGRDRVIDIAAGFDDYRSALRLHWIEVEGPPGYDRYLPRPACQ